jgi:hypothetical protein
MNLNPILTKESTPTKDVGTTVDKTVIPVSCWAIKSNGKMSPLPPDSISHNNYEGPQAMNPYLVLSKSQHPWRLFVSQLTRPWSQYNDEQSNQMAWHHSSPLILFPATIMKALKQ